MKKSIEKNIIIEKLKEFMDSEADKSADEGLAYEMASSLLDEIEEGLPNALQDLPPLKQAILDHALEMDSNDDEENDADDHTPGA